MTEVFSEKVINKINNYLKRYETKRSAILPILHAIQEEYGWINKEQVMSLDNDFSLSRVHVEEVISFYSEFLNTPAKKYRIMLCDSISCAIMGQKETSAKITKLKQKYKSDPDSCPFVLEEVPCLGKCDGAPVMIVNNKRYENVTADKVDKIFSGHPDLA